MESRLLAALLVVSVAFAGPVGASVLYKSVDANGTLTFSDSPPPAGSRILERRMLGTSDASFPDESPVPPAGLEEAFQMLDDDRLLAEANARVDLAERALATARAGHSTTTRPGLNKVSLSIADHERVEFYMRDLRAARQALMDLLRNRQLASGLPVR